MAEKRSARISRTTVLRVVAAGVGMAVMAGICAAPPDPAALVASVKDPEVRAGMQAAIFKNLLPAATEEYYPGFFNISADGGAYGGGASWPGLDSWQMAGAYVLLGKTRLVLDYFEFVRASQRKDGNIPFAIFTGDTRPGGFLSGLHYPEDLYSYVPPRRDGVPASSQETRQWIGLFVHWQPKANSLGALGSTCYLLTASEIYQATRSKPWLEERLPSLCHAADYLWSMRCGNGLISGSGFYTELPPRYMWDGITQCYVIHGFRELAKLCRMAGDKAGQKEWAGRASDLQKSFTKEFWRKDHYGEYVHPEHGLVDTHGLSDVNWAAIAFDIADGKKVKLLWPLLVREPDFWRGGMPTQTVTKPFGYEKWEDHEPVPLDVPYMNDAAAMGRAWYLEALACKRMGARQRLVESVRKVSEAAKADGFWRERYKPRPDGTVVPSAAQKYCEYPAVLIRVVLGSRDWFLK